MDQDVAALLDSERTARGFGGVEPAKNPTQLLRHAARFPTHRWVMHRHAGDLAGDEPVVVQIMEESANFGHRPSAPQPVDAIPLCVEVCCAFDEHGAAGASHPPESSATVHPS